MAAAESISSFIVVGEECHMRYILRDRMPATDDEFLYSDWILLKYTKPTPLTDEFLEIYCEKDSLSVRFTVDT